MRQTLLDMAQQIASSTDSDEFNSIGDTVESLQIAKVIQQCYYDMASELALAEHETLFQLNASGDANKPCLMTTPTNVTKIFSISYDKKLAGETNPLYERVWLLPFPEFIARQQAPRDSANTNTDTMTVSMNGESFTFMYFTDKHPEYYTTTDDYQFIFDSYDSSLDSTLQKTKTLCRGTTYTEFLLEDDYIPDLDPIQFSFLINKAKNRASNELKQMPNQEAAAEARRQKIVMQNNRKRSEDVPEVFKHARYGRQEPAYSILGPKANRGD